MYPIDDGFSLIELLITLAILAILVTFTLPSYSEHLQKTRRIDAKSSLLTFQTQLESCYINHSSYKTCIEELALPHDSVQGFYHIKAASFSSDNYQLIAKPKGTQNLDRMCSTFRVDQKMHFISTDASGKDSTAYCWY